MMSVVAELMSRRIDGWRSWLIDDVSRLIYDVCLADDYCYF